MSPTSSTPPRPAASTPRPGPSSPTPSSPPAPPPNSDLVHLDTSKDLEVTPDKILLRAALFGPPSTPTSPTASAPRGGRLSYPTYFMGQVGEDAHGNLVRKVLEGGGVNLGFCSVIDEVLTGHAVVMLQPDGQNSIIIVGGANTTGWPDALPDEDLSFVKSAGIVLLQREIPDSVNIQVAKASAY